MQLEAFRTIMPEKIKLVGQVPPETCCCMYCLNVKLKIEPINKLLARVGRGERLPSETQFLDFLLCKREEGERWHHPDCLHGRSFKVISPVSPVAVIRGWW